MDELQLLVGGPQPVQQGLQALPRLVAVLPQQPFCQRLPELALQQTRAALRGLPACEVIVAPRERMEQPVIFGEEDASCSLSG